MLLFYLLTCVQKIKSIFQAKIAKYLIQPEIGGSTLMKILRLPTDENKLTMFGSRIARISDTQCHIWSVSDPKLRTPAESTLRKEDLGHPHPVKF